MSDNSNNSANRSDSDRRAFASRTPASENPEPLKYRRGFVTGHQVTGWRFVMRRIASGVALHDARMLVDPLRTQSRAFAMGAIIVITGVAGCFILSMMRPSGIAGTDPVLADRSTAALYVRVGDNLHPVLNLTSARLIAGKAVDPTMVKSAQLDQFPRGNLIGIPGAPERMVQAKSTDAAWAVCESSEDRAVTVIAGSLDTGGDKATEVPHDRAAVVSSESGTWLLWDGKRSALNLGDVAVTSALGFTTAPAARPVTTRLLNAIPEAPPLVVPAIAGAGAPTAYPLPVQAPIGSVLVSYANDNNPVHYVVLTDGVQQVSPVIASTLRNANSYGLEQPPRLTADQIAHLPTSSLIDTSVFPNATVKPLADNENPVLCTRFTKTADAASESWSLLAGSVLPLSSSVHTVQLITPAATPTRVAITPGIGYLVQPGGLGAYQWISDTGVRYGIDTEADGDKTLDALGLRKPALPIPSSILDLFAAGPSLSRTDALLAHDSLAPSNRPAIRIQTDNPSAQAQESR
ncbi:type VII secretion protein EccB [Mycobacterium sp. CBMA271]|uniref:type VII secretion protein EccB n=1 Tax=unclassified Mycobacteroides TaxID=2618759 RepID=UPI0012DEC0C0|nr:MULTISPECIES: type VII secretion protein EccB [unclassified Mycobacteroides]MUM17550.1 type VII secretion protein EccB [Mycobacteroides sp. CBMA 326]MUM24655.1 type VII secretion protein EccB [Mycobacteroides sp. CBMA 271]